MRITRQGLSKTAVKALDNADRLVDYYKRNNPDQRHITLFKRDYDALKSSLAKDKKDITKATYRGFGLKFFTHDNSIGRRR